MNPEIVAALRQGQVIDITTTGRRSGEPRRLEIVFHVIDDRIYISGMPIAGRTRAWLHNLTLDPRLTFHLKNGPVADLAATARVIIDEPERRAILPAIARVWRQDLEAMVAHSPLIEVAIEGLAVPVAA